MAIYPAAKGDSSNTLEILAKIRALCQPNTPLTLIWDNAPYHHSHTVQQAARDLAIQILPLPTYRPDFMPVEHLWQGLREDVTYHTCYNTDTQLIEQVACFEKIINANPHAIADRLWTKTTLDTKQEKLRFSP